MNNDILIQRWLGYPANRHTTIHCQPAKWSLDEMIEFYWPDDKHSEEYVSNMRNNFSKLGILTLKQLLQKTSFALFEGGIQRRQLEEIRDSLPHNCIPETWVEPTPLSWEKLLEVIKKTPPTEIDVRVIPVGNKRMQSALDHCNIHTLKQLCNIGYYELKRVRGCGVGTVNAWKKLLDEAKVEHKLDPAVKVPPYYRPDEVERCIIAHLPTEIKWEESYQFAKGWVEALVFCRRFSKSNGEFVLSHFPNPKNNE